MFGLSTHLTPLFHDLAVKGRGGLNIGYNRMEFFVSKWNYIKIPAEPE